MAKTRSYAVKTIKFNPAAGSDDDKLRKQLDAEEKAGREVLTVCIGPGLTGNWATIISFERK